MAFQPSPPHPDHSSQLDDLKRPDELLRAVLAMQAVLAARAFLPLIRMQTDLQCKAILYGALCVYYMRPFTRSTSLRPLPSEFVPSEMKSTHEKLHLYRDKVAAHSDSDHEHEGVAVNSVYFRSKDNHLLFEDRHQAPSADLLVEVETLLDVVGSRLRNAVGRCLNSGPPSKKAYPAGLYHLRGKGEQDWNFVAVPDDGLADEENQGDQDCDL